MNAKHPATYEINTRSWIKQFGPNAGLKDIPDQYWKQLRKKGIDYVWLMGVWQTTNSSIEAYCFHPDLIRAYDRVNPAWTKEDIYGSPYAIEDYQVATQLGTNEDLKMVQEALHRHHMGLILDFIPNHFNAHSSLIKSVPEVFLQASEAQYRDDTFTIYPHAGRYFAHGKDPYFPAWTDTVQINYFAEAAHEFMSGKLQMLARLSDGVRCDMAMLILPQFFGKTWQNLISNNAHLESFWKTAIPATKQINADFIFIAEAYWDTQWELQQMGFDYTYDKKLLDLLKSRAMQDIKKHLSGDSDYQNKCVRFIENHDEDRSLLELGESRSRMAAVLMSTIPGMKLFYDGQWQGNRTRIPVQMGTSFPETPCPCTLSDALVAEEIRACPCVCQHIHYSKLLPAVSTDALKHGSWQMLEVASANPSVLSWQWTYQGVRQIIIINGHDRQHHIEIKLDVSSASTVIDLLSMGAPPYHLESGILSVDLPENKSMILEIRDL